MAIVKISKDFRITIPKKIREQIKLRAGETLTIYVVDGGIRISRDRPIQELRGMAKGLRWEDDDRDHTDRT